MIPLSSIHRIIAIGDIHGCCKTFKKLLIENLKITRPDVIYLLGDYIDRGPDSKGAIDFILHLRSEGFQIHTLRGNHEQMLLDLIHDNFEKRIWLDNGGNATLKSFNISAANKLPEKYFSFFHQTQLYIQTNDYIFVHAGLNFYNEDIFEDKEAMLWIRDFYPDQPVLGNRLLIHGHTQLPLQAILDQKGNCIDIDGGCVYTSQKNLGYLVAYDLLAKKYIAEKNCE